MEVSYADNKETAEIAARAGVTPESLGKVNAVFSENGIDASRCIKCGRTLDRDDVGAHKKLINRGATLFFCVSCLSAFFNVQERFIREKIDAFKKSGCTLF